MKKDENRNSNNKKYSHHLVVSLMNQVIILSPLETESATIFCIIISTLLFVLVPYCYHYYFNIRSNNINESSKPSYNDTTMMSINPCPNPNCVRCQKYKQIQSSAKRRLPYLIHEWKNKERIRGNKMSCQLSQSSSLFQLQRIVDGVHNDCARSNSMNSFRSSGQYPTVLFVPRLLQPAPSIVTHLHEDACHAFHKNISPTIKDVILQEYIDSQIKDAQWTKNIGTSSIGQSNNKNDEDHLWEVLYLMNQGKWNQNNIQLYCPKTYSFISKKVNGLMEKCIFGNIFISVLYPGTKIEPHCGPTNIRHRLHYALSVPDTKDNPLILKVRDEVLTWKEGEVFVFDDSLVHSAEFIDNNTTSEVRVVLVIDLWHPSLSLDERKLLSDLYPPL